ncbi:hypothetical protein DHEL01_v207454 [Diaporthe helianthi]|uniref:Uncharacterized protein n=1 Tax=Diaporthe helianthi TaxID=158607 RepID=A0A2P5HVA4_DIAHE|nr:hypothetical protein DHEL01_v207454 [Diaporthe helianthi]
MHTCLAQAAAALRLGRNVVVYGIASDGLDFRSLEQTLGHDVEYDGYFSTGGITRDVNLDAENTPMFFPQTFKPKPALVFIEPCAFSTALPLVNVGMVVSIVTKLPRMAYDDQLHLVALSSGARSLHSQRWTGQVRDTQGFAETTLFIEIVDLDEGGHLQRTKERMLTSRMAPMILCEGALIWCTCGRISGHCLQPFASFWGCGEPVDLAVRLQSMGLVERQRSGYINNYGFVFTSRGERAESLIRYEPTLTLEAATALAGIDMKIVSKRVARSILRLSFMKEMSGSFIQEGPMHLQDHDAFKAFLRGVPQDAEQGGPERNSASRGLIWLIWTDFEMYSHRLGVSRSEMTLSIANQNDGRTSVSGLMLFDYSVCQELIGDLEAEDADPLQIKVRDY